MSMAWRIYGLGYLAAGYAVLILAMVISHG